MKHSIFTILMFCSSLTVAMAQKFDVTVTGKIYDTQGRGIPEVIVNDGVHFTKSNKKGYYRITADTMISKYITISTPAQYELPQKKGIASGFYVALRDIVKKKTENKFYDFKLIPRKNMSDRFYYIAISDPQMQNEHDYNRWNTETVTDIKKEVAKLNVDYEVVGNTLGDLVFDNKNIWERYKKSIENLGMTIFNCIGNHDCYSKYTSYYYNCSFGPTDYSYNVGKVHIITLNNINYLGNGKYVEMLTPNKIEWLKKDLSYVPKGTTIFLNMHAASFNKWDKSANMRNAAELEAILKDYKVHYFCGHTHYYENEVPSETLYQHNIGAACGAWWFGDVNRDGAPNGYLIVDVNGTDVKWHYKSTKDPITYQFRIYKQGEFRSQKDYIVANVWDYDEECKVEWSENGVSKGKMDQFLDEDEDYLKIMRNKNYGCHTAHLFRIKPSTDAKKIEITFTNRFGEQYSQVIDINKQIAKLK